MIIVFWEVAKTPIISFTVAVADSALSEDIHRGPVGRMLRRRCCCCNLNLHNCTRVGAFTAGSYRSAADFCLIRPLV